MIIVIAAPDKRTNHPIFVRTEIKRKPTTTKVLEHYNESNPTIRHKSWSIKNKKIRIGAGPYRVYKRLMGRQYGIVFRGELGTHIIAISNTRQGVEHILRSLEKKLDAADFARIGFRQHEPNVQIPRPHIAKRHHHKVKRRKSLANRHLNWWQKTPGFPKNLDPPPISWKTQADLAYLEQRYAEGQPTASVQSL